VLAGGRLVSGSQDGQVLLWDLATPSTAPVVLGRHDGQVLAVAKLPEGWVVSGGVDGRVMLWDPEAPGATPIEFGRHVGWVMALAVLPGGRLVIGSTDRLSVWDVQPPRLSTYAECSARVLATGSAPSGGSRLIVAHRNVGMSIWSIHA